MSESTLNKQITECVCRIYESMKDDVEASVEYIAGRVICELDPHAISPMTVRHSAIMNIRHVTRHVMRKQTRSVEALDTSTEDMFGAALQVRYPCERDSQLVYVKREHMTIEERQQNSQALRAEAKAKLAHADALDAETAYLVAMGHLRQTELAEAA
jgi:hypothetical protein